MRVIHIISSLDGGGAELMLLRLILKMDTDQHIVIALKNNGVVGEDLKNNNIPTHALNLTLLTFLYDFYKMYKIIKIARPHIVQTWMYQADLIGGIAAYLVGLKNICWNIRNTYINAPRLSLRNLILYICAWFSHYIPNRIICCSQSGYDEHVKMGYCARKMIFIPNGYDTSLFKRSLISKSILRSCLKIPITPFVVCVAARFDFLKGHDVIIKAAGYLAQYSKSEYLFLFIGRGINSNNEILMKAIADSGFGAKFMLLEHKKSLKDYMEAVDLLCLPSRSEGFPNVIPEAMLMEVPCVSTNVGDAGIIMQGNGLLVEVENHIALGEAIERIAKMSSKDRCVITTKAKKNIVDLYDINHISKCYRDLYHSMLSSSVKN